MSEVLLLQTDLGTHPHAGSSFQTSFQPFLGKEWLVKTNSSSSTPYLFKLVSSTIDLTCSILFTDTKSVWLEELTGQQIARRWRQCNPRAPASFTNTEDEDEWRTSILELLGRAHTLGGVNALTFQVVETNYSDVAFLLESTSFSWRWETCFVGHKLSAETISRQLVLPLISTNHLMFTSAEPIQVMSDTDVEKAVDKIGRTARRSVDTHIKNALSKPRVSTILRRTTAMFNSLQDLPNIISSVEEPDLQITATTSASPKTTHKKSMPLNLDVEMSEPPQTHRPRSPMRISPSPRRAPKSTRLPVKGDSATESSEDEGEPSALAPTRAKMSQSQTSRQLTPKRLASPEPSYLQPAASPNARSKSPLVEPSRSTTVRAKTPEQAIATGGQTSDDDSSPVKPPQKKAKAAQLSSSDSDSEAERKARVAQLKGNAIGGGTAKRGVRQPIKRGGKRF
ncbi:hypothetical protein NP233_g7426 [Leucocoprinus birnbaumii]|uniref:XLF-like N-terminal domain-containing protein n=1 Tax=Leucocoprinus birnbaumii TaxID=56174 RepID=A0AAD5VPE1_9AGAR|nr:hypothetical protein NP233_g7426 [Leucocoprinus birnbaumii]